MTSGGPEMLRQLELLRDKVREQLGARYNSKIGMLGRMIAMRTRREGDTVLTAAIGIIARTEMVDSPPTYVMVAALEILDSFNLDFDEGHGLD